MSKCWVINFEDKSQGLYTLSALSETNPVLQGLLPKNWMITTEPDLEAIALLVPAAMQGDYTPIDTVRFKSAPDFDPFAMVKKEKHQILVGGEWEIRAKLKAITPQGFVFSHSGGHTFTVSEFGLGEPDDE